MLVILKILPYVLAVYILAGQAYAQKTDEKGMSKKELKQVKKKWKKKAKTYVKNPLALKAKEEAFQKEVEDLNKKNAELAKKNAELLAEIEKCACSKKFQEDLKKAEEELKKCQEALKTAQADLEKANTEMKRLQTALEASKGTSPGAPAKGPEVNPGLFFRVQIGAYEKFQINKHLSNTEDNFSGESVDNMNKYLIGRFKNYTLAQAFRQEIIKLGIKDAWVVAYNDGVRIDIKEALKLQEKQRR